MNSRILIAVLGAVAMGGIAYATQTSADAAAPAKDPPVTLQQFLDKAKAQFAALDINRDGVLSGDERRGKPGAGGVMGGPLYAAGGQAGTPPPPAAGAGVPGRGMERLDTDGDGRISRAEFDAQTARRFQRMDTNGDGTIDASEMAARRGQPGARTDADASGTLTKAEFDAQAARRFQQMDANGDGFIDQSERPAAPPRGDRGPPPAPTPKP